MRHAMPVDVAIRGAGPVGCVLALLLGQSGRSVRLSDNRAVATAALQPALRPLALSHASRLILERVGAWAGLAPTPILTVHVSQQGRFGRAQLSAADAGVPALGYVVDYGRLLRSLLDRLDREKIRVGTEEAEARLVVHAEGAAADATEKDYGQEALVALVATEPPAGSTAWERFTPGGPLALLPLGARFGLVWGLPALRASELCEAPEAEFLAALSLAFGRRAGAFVSVDGRNRVRLALRVRPTRLAQRQAFIGNAAQTLHPVAGQGLNLGLRDAWDLARVLRDAEDPGEARALQRFAQVRRIDAAATVRVTDFLARAFLGDDPLAGLMRGIGLSALDICLPARRFFARRMIFGASALP
jgi:2-octaprenyl-6-methoxyphenol hydroxylase